MNYFTSKINTIRDQTVTLQPSATVSHQIVHYRSLEEQFHLFSTIGEEELYKLVKSVKPTTCMLDPIPSKLLKEVFPEFIDPILAIINLSLALGYVPKTFKLAVIKPLIKKTTTWIQISSSVFPKPVLEAPLPCTLCMSPLSNTPDSTHQLVSRVCKN